MARWMNTREQQLVKQRVAVSRNNHILVFCEVFKTSLTFQNSFNICFVILLTLCHTCCCTWPILHTCANSVYQASSLGRGGSWERGYLAKCFHSSSECKDGCFQLYLVNTVRTWLLVMVGQHLNSSVHVHIELPHEVR